MGQADYTRFNRGDSQGGGKPSGRLMMLIPAGLLAILILGLVYLGYFWFIRRVVVGPNEVLIVMRKNGTTTVPGDQIIIPKPPDKAKDEAAYLEWEKEFGNANGIFEEVFRAGTYFRFSPFDYEREVINVKDTANVPPGKVGIVIKKFGKNLPPNQVMAGPGQRGPMPDHLKPGIYPDLANPYAYEIKQVDPLTIDPGYRGVVTVMAGKPAANPNAYLVNDQEQGIQSTTETEGFRYVNPYEKRITPISIRSQRFEMSGDEAIQFPSSDSFEIKLEGFVEWSIMPDRLPETYAKYAEGAELIPLVENTMILPYARSYSRLVGSQYNARDFISGDTKLKFQAEFEAMLREACAKQGVEILQALVRDIIPPEEIKRPINEREIAKEQIFKYEQQIIVAETSSRLAMQEEQGIQNKAIGEANQEVVGIVKKAEQARDVAVTRSQQDLAVAKLRLEAAQKQADAIVARGEAEANVILLNRQAEAEPLRRQIEAFGNGEAYARYFFYQKIAPSIKSILTNVDGPFADLFKQFMAVPAEPVATPAGAVQPQSNGVEQ